MGRCSSDTEEGTLYERSFLKAMEADEEDVLVRV
jgi:hypothetical protein